MNSKPASQRATIVDSLQVCFQTRSVWHRSLQGRFRVPHWWCGVSHTAHTGHQPDFSFPCTIGWYFLEWNLGFTWIHKSSKFKSYLSWHVLMISRHLLHTEVMNSWRVEHAIHGRWDDVRLVGLIPEEAIERKLAEWWQSEKMLKYCLQSLTSMET